MKKILLLFIFLIPFVPAFAQFDVGTMASSRSSIHAPAAPTVTPTGFTPSSATASDTAVGGSLIIGLSVTLSNGHTFNGTCGYGTPQNNTDPTGLTTLSSTSGGCNLNVNSSGYTSANDGTYQLTINPCQSGQCLNPSSPNFTLIINNSTTGNLTPSSATIANDIPGNMFVMAVRIPGQVNTTNCSWSGDAAFTVFNWTFANDTSVPPRVACEVVTTSGSPSVGDHTGTITLGAKSETFTVHVNSGTMTASPAKTNQVAHGQYCCGISGNPPYSFSIGGTYTDGCGGGWGFPSGQNLVTDLHSIVCGLHYSEYSAADWHDAATGGYDAEWLSVWQNLMGAAYAAHQWYSVRLNSEWSNGDAGSSGCSEPGGPWYNDPGCMGGDGSGPIPVADWVGAVERIANVIHTNFPGVVVELDSPYVRSTTAITDVNYVPASLAPYIDIWGVDWYYFTQYLPATSPQAYQTTDGIAGNGYGEASQPGQVGFAAAMGTEIAMPEWCDEFTDYNPGYLLTRLIYQMIDYGAAYESYWNSDDDSTTCILGNNVGANAAYNNIFGSWSYNGSFSWGAHTPWVPQ